MTAGFAWHSVLIDRPEGATETLTTVEVVMFARMRFLIFSAAEPSLQVPCLLVVVSSSFDKPRPKMKDGRWKCC